MGSKSETIEIAPGRTMQFVVRGGASPVRVLHLHGGAFAGTVRCGAPVAAVLAEAGAVVFSADYPVGTAHPFPEALEAVYAALMQLARGRSRHPWFVAGEEAGGNLAAALALMCRDRLQPKLAGQILLSPMLDPRLGTCSVRAVEAGAAGCKWAIGWHEYLRSADRACHPYAAPSLALRLAGVAPALIVTGPNDPMADEARDYAARLRESGVKALERRIAAGESWPDALLGAAASAPSWAAELREAAAEFYATAATRTSAQHC